MITTLFRNPYGELVRALGMAFILVLSRTTRIRKTYPSHRYLLPFWGLAPRRPFPPSRNPWRYTPQRPRDPEFQMLMTLAAMAVVGSAVGGNLPLIPTWLGALCGAATFCFGTTLPSARGDLCRCMGMRVVQVTIDLWDIQGDLRLWPKIGIVSSKILDKMLVLDRKHRIKDRIVDTVSMIYQQVSKTAANASDGFGDEDDRQERRHMPEDRGRPPRPRRGDDSDDYYDRPRDRFDNRGEGERGFR
jgi:hypothetical protein